VARRIALFVDCLRVRHRARERRRAASEPPGGGYARACLGTTSPACHSRTTIPTMTDHADHDRPRSRSTAQINSSVRACHLPAETRSKGAARNASAASLQISRASTTPACRNAPGNERAVCQGKEISSGVTRLGADRPKRAPLPLTRLLPTNSRLETPVSDRAESSRAVTRIERQSTVTNQPYANLLPMVDLLLRLGNVALNGGFIMNPDGRRCRLVLQQRLVISESSGMPGFACNCRAGGQCDPT
jgi:hypothetical protein